MQIPRFFLFGRDLESLARFSSGVRAGDILELAEDDLINQIRNVLRLHRGSVVRLIDDQSKLYECEIKEILRSRITLAVAEVRTAGHELPVRVQMAPCLIKGERFDWLLEKLTELGTGEIVPLLSRRTVVKAPSGESTRLEGKLRRWRNILRESAEQCERSTIPSIVPPLPLEQYLTAPTIDGLEHVRLICLERTAAPPATSTITGEEGLISIAVGPEGGFTEQEINTAMEAGWLPVSLGPRILRSETACMSIMAQVASLLDYRKRNFS